LNLELGQGLAAGQIDMDERSLWRYRAALRADARQRISLGEGWTPLLFKALYGADVGFKLEYLAPTGSFKDRGMSVLLTYLRSVGVDSILEDSSGNAGASMAAYAAAGGLRCTIFVPAGAPPNKVSQISAMGAEVELIPGNRQDVADAALRKAEHVFYASHNWQPFFLEGTKTLAFELWEQLGFQAPHSVIVPLGYGSNVLGLRLGFDELIAAGAIKHLPRIFGVQAANCSAFRLPWERRLNDWIPFEAKSTVADGIASLRPVRMKEVLSAMRDSAGELVTVTEEEIATALAQLASIGLLVEPTSATAAAALLRLQRSGTLDPAQKTVVVLTGSGLKAMGQVSEILSRRGI
jgi:threonine synthase